MSWLVRITAAAANANIFIINLAEFWPRVREPRLRALVLALLLGLLGAVNYRGVRSGAKVSNLFTVAKLVPLAIFLVAGTIFVLVQDPATPPLASSATPAQWIEAVLLLFFAYGGYDGALMPLGEAKNPRRDAPFALFTAMIALFMIYAGIQWIVMAVLPNPVATDRPLADAAGIFLGRPGAMLMAVGALVSVYGYLSANVLNAPRLTFALAARRDFPLAFAWLHPRYHTPYFSILAFVGITWLLAVRADFRWNAQLSGVTRLFTYGSACLALIVLRRRSGAEPAAFRLPAGDAFAVIGLVFCLGLMTGMGWIHLLVVGVTILIALVNWLWARRQGTAPT
jgi:APA family basic amino acid/polyamine antiporter